MEAQRVQGAVRGKVVEQVEEPEPSRKEIVAFEV